MDFTIIPLSHLICLLIVPKYRIDHLRVLDMFHPFVGF